MYAEGFPEKYLLVPFDSEKVNEIHGTTFGLWSSVKLNCCWAQQLLPVTSYLNSEKWAASGLLGKGNHQAGRCPSGIAAVSPGWDHGCRLSQRCAKPVGHSISWAATKGAPAGWRGTKDYFGELRFFSCSPSHSSHSSFSTSEQYSLCAFVSTRQKGSNWSLLPWRNRSCFPKYFKNSIQTFVDEPSCYIRFISKDTGKEIQPGQHSCLGEWLSLWTLILNEGDENKVSHPTSPPPRAGSHDVTHKNTQV